MATVLIPTSMRRLTGGEGAVVVAGTNLDEVLHNLETRSPGIGKELCADGGRVRDYILVFVNGEQVQESDPVRTVVDTNDEVQFLPAVAGG
jgi:molybdopterin converting factor small subunit